MRLLVDEDTASATLITRLLAAGHEVVQLPLGMPDELSLAKRSVWLCPFSQPMSVVKADATRWGSTNSLSNGLNTVVSLASFALRQVVGSRIA